MKKNRLRGVVILILLMGLAGCLVFSGDAFAADVEQKLAVNIGPVPTIDPQFSTSQPGTLAIRAYAEGLITNFFGEIRPGVAESWEIAPDNMSMTFHLRKDACWSDGSPLNAHDFVYSIRRLADPNNASDVRWLLAEVVNGEEITYGPLSQAEATPEKPYVPIEKLGVSAPDDYTVVLNFDTPAPYFIGVLDHPAFFPVKQELVERYCDQYGTTPEMLLGNGPFVIKEYLVDEKIVYVPNENYWDRESVKLEEVTCYQWSDDQVEFDAFRGGELNVADVPLVVAAEYKKGNMELDGASVHSFMSGAIDWFSINIGSATNPILGNRDFRLALNYALDRKEYISIATNDLYFPNTRFVLPMIAGSSAASHYCDEYPLDVFKTNAEMEKAKRHLQLAMDALNINDPSKINVAIKIQDTPTNKLIAENCQDQWKRSLGINVTIDTVTFPAMIADRISGNFDLVYAGWMPNYNDPYAYMTYFLSSNDRNGGKFSNARYDELVTTANQFSDVNTRLKMYAEAEEILLNEAALVPLHIREVVWVKNDNFKEFDRFFLVQSGMDFRYSYFE